MSVRPSVRVLPSLSWEHEGQRDGRTGGGTYRGRRNRRGKEGSVRSAILPSRSVPHGRSNSQTHRQKGKRGPGGAAGGSNNGRARQLPTGERKCLTDRVIAIIVRVRPSAQSLCSPLETFKVHSRSLPIALPPSLPPSVPRSSLFDMPPSPRCFLPERTSTSGSSTCARVAEGGGATDARLPVMTAAVGNQESGRQAGRQWIHATGGL